MIIGSISGQDGLDAILNRLRRYRNIDLRPLAERVAAIIQADLRESIASGTSPTGGSFAPLAESTRRSLHGRDSTPGGGSTSSLVRDLTVSVEPDRNGSLTVVVGWRGETAQKAIYFDRGNAHQPARPIRGISDSTRAKVADAVADFARTLTQG